MATRLHALIFRFRHVRQPLRERDLCGRLRSEALRRGMVAHFWAGPVVGRSDYPTLRLIQ